MEPHVSGSLSVHHQELLSRTTALVHFMQLGERVLPGSGWNHMFRAVFLSIIRNCSAVQRHWYTLCSSVNECYQDQDGTTCFGQSFCPSSGTAQPYNGTGTLYAAR